jgi:hypothetical protein
MGFEFPKWLIQQLDVEEAACHQRYFYPESKKFA